MSATFCHLAHHRILGQSSSRAVRCWDSVSREKFDLGKAMAAVALQKRHFDHHKKVQINQPVINKTCGCVEKLTVALTPFNFVEFEISNTVTKVTPFPNEDTFVR